MRHDDDRGIGSPAAAVAVATPAAVRRLGRRELRPTIGGDSRAQGPELQEGAVHEPVHVELLDVLVVAAALAALSVAPAALAAGAAATAAALALALALAALALAAAAVPGRGR